MPPLKQPLVSIWTDGSVIDNPGTGGWAAVIRSGENQKELWGHEYETTNQRQELLAAIKALKALKRPCQVKLYSDSAYLINSQICGWIGKWKANGWKNAKGKPVANRTLWEILEEAASRHDIEWVKVTAHKEDEGNNKADALAYLACQAAELRRKEAS